MKTLITDSPDEAAEVIRSGGVVAFPTETVYGLGANVFDAGAVAKIFEAKKRPADNPLIAHVAAVADVDKLAHEVTPSARILIEKFFPGPLTVVVRRSPMVPNIATARLNTIGIRMPRNDLARSFLAACETPVVAPSANLSGRPSPTTWQAVAEDLDGRIDCILKGDPTEIGIESTVVDCTGEMPVLLRSGAVSLDVLKNVVPDLKVYSPVTDEPARSPGLKHKHYSPRARVMIWDANYPDIQLADTAYIGLESPAASLSIIKIVRSVGEYARELFEFFRECDRRHVDTIYCQPVSEEGIGSALMDRIRRASER